ncbi:hypothetical protein ACFL59_13935 [Planctomycetota bacterium]
MRHTWQVVVTAAVITIGMAGTGLARPTWNFKLEDETGPNRLAAVEQGADAARETAALSTALCIEWVLQLIEDGQCDVRDLNDTSDLKKLAKGIGAIFAKQRGLSADAFPELGAALYNFGLQIQVVPEAARPWKSRTLSKAVKNLENGQRYLLMAYAKRAGSGFWYVVGVDRATGAKAVFDPFAGQFTEQKSGNVASYLMDKGKVAERTGAKLEYFTVLKCSKPMNYGAIARLLKKAGKKTNAHYQKWCKTIFAKKGLSNYIHKDIRRFVPQYVLVNRGNVVKERFDDTTGSEFLQKLKEALGADVEIPEQGLFDRSKIGQLKAFCEENYAGGTEWETVLRMLCQQHGGAVVIEFRREALNAGLSDQPQPYTQGGTAADRFTKEDGWHFRIDVTDEEVKVTQPVVMCEWPGTPVKYKVRIFLVNLLDRNSLKVSAEVTKVETTKGNFKD